MTGTPYMFYRDELYHSDNLRGTMTDMQPVYVHVMLV